MKYCRFLLANQIHYGVVEERKGELWITGPAPAPEEDLAFRLAVEQTAAASFDFEPMPLRNASLLAPVTPSKIVCVGRNYQDHVKELGNEVPAEPLLFFKPPSSLLNPRGTVLLPAASTRVDFEGELALVIGRRVHKLAPDADLHGVIRGYTLGIGYEINKYFGFQSQILAGKNADPVLDDNVHFQGSIGVRVSPIHIQVFGAEVLELSLLGGAMSAREDGGGEVVYPDYRDGSSQMMQTPDIVVGYLGASISIPFTDRIIASVETKVHQQAMATSAVLSYKF